MVTELLFCMLVLANTLATGIHNSDSHQERRDLDSCSSYSTGSECDFYDNCNYLNSKGQNNYPSTWQYNTIDKTEMSSYCHNSLGDDYIYARDFGYDLEIYSYKNATVSTYEYCEWRIVFSSKSPISLNIKRDSENYEEIYLYTSSSTNENYYYSKDFLNCGSKELNITYEDTTYIRLRIKKLNDLSSYTIGFTQDVPGFKPNYAALIIAITGGGIVGLGLVGSIIFCIIYVARAKIIEAKRRKLTPAQITKIDFINRCLKNMRSGKFVELEVPFEQTSCIVCLEDFESETEVNIVNECLHVFHYKCLNYWFRNISGSKDLVCPHCNIVITDKSKPGDPNGGGSNSSKTSRALQVQETNDNNIVTNARIQIYSVSVVESQISN